MTSPAEILCDGCGQAADQKHLTRRLKRLENMTRYRPIHVQALFLAAASPVEESDYLYSAEGEFRGEGLRLLEALGLERVGKPVESVLSEFQRRGFLFTHVLECPPRSFDARTLAASVEQRLAQAAARIRRSLKPKKLILLGEALDPVGNRLATELPGVETLLSREGNAFRLGELAAGELAGALGATAARSLC